MSFSQMARARTSTSGDQEHFHVTASRRTIQDRDKGQDRGRGRGRGRIVPPLEGQVAIATSGRNRTVPPDVDVICWDVQDYVEGDGPGQKKYYFHPTAS